MKRLLLSLGCALATVLLTTALAADAGAKKPKAPKAPKRGSIVHMVAFKFKPEATQDQIKQIEMAFGALKQKIPQVVSFHWGTNISPEKLDKGFTHGFVLTFKDEKDRDAYLNHPDHKEFGKRVSPILADVFVVDFKAQKK